MVCKSLIIKNKTGLHARPASLFVELANKFKSEILVKKDNMVINGKSIMGVMTLGASQGTEITIEVDGSDEEEALDALVKLVESNFYEDE